MTLCETYTKKVESHSVLDMNGPWVWSEIVQCVTLEHFLSIDHFTTLPLSTWLITNFSVTNYLTDIKFWFLN